MIDAETAVLQGGKPPYTEKRGGGAYEYLRGSVFTDPFWDLSHCIANPTCWVCLPIDRNNKRK